MLTRLSSSTKRAARLIMFVLVLAMFAVAAGAPEFIGPIGH
jgi:hypothetical protein